MTKKVHLVAEARADVVEAGAVELQQSTRWCGCYGAATTTTTATTTRASGNEGARGRKVRLHR